MKKTRDILLIDYLVTSKRIDEGIYTEKEYAALITERDNLRNELIKYDTVHNDKIKTIGTIGMGACGFVGSMYGMHRAFKFDEACTMTSTWGRNMVNTVVSWTNKLFK